MAARNSKENESTNVKTSDVEDKTSNLSLKSKYIVSNALDS